MKAAVFHGPHEPLTIEDVEIDKPGPREVLVKTVASGVCHSDLHFVDGVVAENGAVVHFPDREHTSVLAPPVARLLVKGLEEEHIPFQAGQCLIDADAADGPRLLAVIRRLELPYVLAFNRGRVMVICVNPKHKQRQG